MTHVIECPTCKSRLRVQPGSTEDFLSCPRCLGRVPNPHVAPVAAPEPLNTVSAVAATPVPAEVSSEPLSCPGCGKPVDPVWLFCPHCEERLREYRTTSGIEGSVRRDTQRTSWLLIVLAVIGGLPVMNLVFVLLAGIVQGEPEAALGGGVALLILLGAGTLVAYIRAMHAGRTLRFGRVVFTTFALTGGLVAVGLALMVFAFIVCLAAFSGGKC